MRFILIQLIVIFSLKTSQELVLLSNCVQNFMPVKQRYISYLFFSNAIYISKGGDKVFQNIYLNGYAGLNNKFLYIMFLHNHYLPCKISKISKVRIFASTFIKCITSCI